MAELPAARRVLSLYGGLAVGAARSASGATPRAAWIRDPTGESQRFL